MDERQNKAEEKRKGRDMSRRQQRTTESAQRDRLLQVQVASSIIIAMVLVNFDAKLALLLSLLTVD